jgi:hypothetical protein
MSQPHASGSVKISGGLLHAARTSAELACRSTAGQIEYWAKLGRSVEEGGLSNIDAQRAIGNLGNGLGGADFAGLQAGRQQTVSSLSARLLAAHHSGSLAQRVREVVQHNAGTPLAAAA